MMRVKRKYFLMVVCLTTLWVIPIVGNWAQVNQELEKHPALKNAVAEAFYRNRRVNVEGGRDFQLKLYPEQKFATITFWFVSSQQGYESLWTMLCKDRRGYWNCHLTRD